MPVFDDPLDPAHALPTVLRERAATTPDRVFVRDLDHGLVESYGVFDARVDRWAGQLAALGVAPGHAVVSLLPSSADAIAVWVAAARLGAVEVPVNPAYRGNLLAHMVRTAAAQVVVTCQEYVDSVLETIEATPDVSTIVLVDGVPPDADSHAGRQVAFVMADPEAAPASSDVLGEVAPWDLSCVLYTSGTTGPSKGVMVTWAQALMSVTGCFPTDDLGSDDHFYIPYPLFHMSGKLCVYGAALLGSEVVLRRRFSLSGWWSDIDDNACTSALMIGSVPQLVAGREPSPEDRAHTLRNVEIAPMPENAAELAERFGLRFSTVFNMTEISCPIMTGWTLGPPSSVGRLRPGYQVRIVDEYDRELPHGQLGEIIVRADIPWVLNVGYWRMPDKTVEAWRNGWFHTGDAGHRDEAGNYWFVDRIKDAIRRGGENISSMELEAEIAEHPGVLECAAIGVPSPLGEQEVLVFVVPEGDEVDLADVHAFCRDRLPKFMVPRYFVVVDDLPKTPTEKIRKGVLKDKWQDHDLWDATAESTT